MIGLIIKEAIEASQWNADQVAVDSDMSVANLYKIYKRDSVESRYLVKICRKLKIPFSALLGPEDWLENSTAGGSNLMVAHKTGSNNQQYSVRGSEKNEGQQLQHQLELCQVERESLANQLAMQKEINELLRSK